jgi:mannosylglycerate hydrolase
MPETTARDETTMKKTLRMHVISGTHWDREWRHTAEQSKPRLVELVDTMMDVLEKHDSYATYCLDGGQVVVEDYLTIRPESRGRLEKLIRAGRVHLVNWYTLPDMFTVAAEAQIRNLMVGRRMAREFGGAMASGYTATSYGQHSQLPQLYQGFGISNAIFYRGTNRHVLPPLFLMEGADGTRIHILKTFDEVTRTNWYFYVHQPLVLGKPARDLSYTYDPANMPVHMCDERHYERAFKLLQEEHGFRRDEVSLKAALGLIVDQASPYAIGEHILALNLEDNDVPFALLPDMIAALNAVSPDVEIVQDSIDGFMATVTAETDPAKLVVHRGELRYPVVEAGFNGLLGATHSSRVKLKILNENAETGLIHFAEPMASIASLLGNEYPRTSLDRAWLHLLKNQAHDSICGAAVDQAHEDMLYNFSIARMVGEEITARAATFVFGKIDTAGAFQPGDHTITLFNALPQEREEIVLLAIDLPKQAVSGVVDPCTGVGAVSKNIEHFDILDSEGRPQEYEVVSREDVSIAVERELDTSVQFPAVRRRILVRARVPGLGHATLGLRPRGPRFVPLPETGTDRPLLARENGVMENEHLKVTINPNGTFDLLHKATGRVMPGQHYFTDNGEVGVAHLSRMPVRNPVQTSLGAAARITMVEAGLLRGVYRIDLSMTVPAAATLDGRDRLREEREIPITTWLTLEKGSRYLKLRTRLTNDARDHRLRVNFPTDIRDAQFAAVESAFAVDRRPIRWTESGDNAEGFYPFQPMQNFVDVSDGKAGLAVLNKGLREYEVKDDAGRTIAITLLRTHRAYMTANAAMTPEEFDKYTGLHSFGTLECRYALLPHQGDWEEGGVLQAAYEHKVGIPAIQGLPYASGPLPATGSVFSVTPADKLVLSALKQAEDGDGMILRLWNNSGDTVDARIACALPLASSESLRLDETHPEPLPLEGNSIRCHVGPHKIVTIRVKARG